MGISSSNAPLLRLQEAQATPEEAKVMPQKNTQRSGDLAARLKTKGGMPKRFSGSIDRKDPPSDPVDRIVHDAQKTRRKGP